jgi:hypothetical protein
MVYREMREYGISLICLDQHISKLSDTVKGNSACHIAFQQQLPQDVIDISNIMQLNDRKEFFSKLQVGSAIVKLSERYTSPFLINVPFAGLRSEIITDDVISKRMSCIVEGFEVEKNDSEFKEAMINPIKIEVSCSELPEELKNMEVEMNIPDNSFFNQTQKVLYNFSLDQISQGKTLNEIEKILEEGLKDKYYSELDILKVINFTLSNEFNKKSMLEYKEPVVIESEIIQKKSNIKPTLEILGNKEEYNFIKYLNEEEQKFVIYLIGNPIHSFSTVEFYKEIGMSPRKGNVIKNNLMNKGLIIIKEEKNEKGWKKLIRLNNSLIESHSQN